MESNLIPYLLTLSTHAVTKLFSNPHECFTNDDRNICANEGLRVGGRFDRTRTIAKSVFLAACMYFVRPVYCNKENKGWRKVVCVCVCLVGGGF